MHLKDEAVYSDRRWLVYMLDQIIGNAVKYRGENPTLTFGADISSACGTEFWVEDNGTGIARRNCPIYLIKAISEAVRETAATAPREWACIL